MKTTILYFSGGVVQAVNGETVETISAALGTPAKRRASHVWPVNPVKRASFRILRRIFGEEGIIPNWCRAWRGPWEVRFIDPLNHKRIGAVVFSHESRQACIEWEIIELNRKLAKQP